MNTLARLSGKPQVDAFYLFQLSLAMDLEQMERTRLRRHMFLARFARQSLLQWDDVDARVVRRYADVLAEFLQEENEAAKRAAESND